MHSLALLFSLVLISLIPWENAITVSEFGTLTRVIGLLTAMIWFGSKLVVGRFRSPHPFHITLLFFVLWNIVSIFWSSSVDATILRIQTYIQLAILTYIFWDLIVTPKALKAVLQSYILGAYVAIFTTISNYLVGQEISRYSGRYAGSSMNAVDLALILILGVPIAWHLATSDENCVKSRFLKLINYGYIPAAIFASLLTASRTIIFVTIPVILYILGTVKSLKLSQRIVIFIVMISAMYFLQPLIPQSSIERLGTVGGSIAVLDLGGRVALWREAIVEFSEHPLLGVGSGAFYTVAHNTFFSILAELGIVGFVLFLIILVVVLHQALDQPKIHSRLWVFVLMVWFIGVFTLTWEYRKPTWLILTLVIISGSLYDRHEYKMEASQSLGERFGKQGDLTISGDNSTEFQIRQ